MKHPIPLYSRINGDNTISTGGVGNGPITIAGVSVTQSDYRHNINAGSDKIIIDGNASFINLAGYLTTTYDSTSGGDYAILLRDATTVQFAAVSASACRARPLPKLRWNRDRIERLSRCTLTTRTGSGRPSGVVERTVALAATRRCPSNGSSMAV